MENHRHLQSDKIYYQPGLFDDGSNVSELRQEYGSLRTSLNNLRKGLFQRFTDLSKLVMNVMLRQDERDLEISQLNKRLNELEERLRNSNYKSPNSVRTLHIVGHKKRKIPFYMSGN